MKNKTVLILKILLGLLILSALVVKVGVREIISSIKSISPVFILIIIFCFFLSSLLGTTKLKLMLKPIKNIPFLKLFKYYIIAWALSLFMPGRTGDLSLIYFFKKENINYGEGSAIFLLDKITAMTVMFLFLLFGITLFFNISQSLQIIIILLLLAFFFLIAIFTNFGRSLIKKFILRSFSKKFKGFSKLLFNYLKNQKKILSINFVISLTKLTIQVTPIFLLLGYFNSYISLPNVITIKSITALLSLIPISFNNLGIKESVGVFLYSKLGVNPVAITSIYIYILIVFYLTALVCVIMFPYKKVLNKPPSLNNHL